MSEWKEQKLGDIAEINMGQSPESKYYNLIGEGLPFLQGNRTFGLRFPSFDTFCSDPKKIAMKGEILFSVRAPVGDINIAPTNICIGRGLASFNSKNGINRYLFYLLHFVKRDIINAESGTVFGSVNRNDLENIKILVPNNEEQIAIAEVLSSLDDKIDLLHRQNKSLEQLAETLFKQWFVEEAEESWRKSKIGEVLETALGGTPSTAKPEYWDGDIPWINSGEINKFRINEPTRFITKLGLENSSTKLLPIGTTVIAITGATLGQISLLEIETCANQSVIGIIPNSIFTREFVFLWVKYKLNEIISNETGGAQQHINKNDVNECDIIIPPQSLIQAKILILNSYFEKITINTTQIRTLTKLRDTLLPKLMSGEVRVKEYCNDKKR